MYWTGEGVRLFGNVQCSGISKLIGLRPGNKDTDFKIRKRNMRLLYIQNFTDPKYKTIISTRK